LRLWLVGHFRLTTSWAEVAVGDCGARLLAPLALRDGRITRCGTAGTPWPETSDDHAQGSLRSALRRLPGAARRAVEVTGHDLSLAPTVEVDLHERRSLAYRLLDPPCATRTVDLSGEAMRQLSTDLLPTRPRASSTRTP
jgi:DNA-binding SARP family transcriptional activator